MAAVLNAGAVAIRRWELPNVGISQNAHTAANTAAAPTVRDLAALEAQAHDEGYAAGHAEGLAAAQQQVREHIAQLDTLFASAARPIQTLDAQTEQQLAALAGIPAWKVGQANRFGATMAEAIAHRGPSLVEVDMTAIGEFPPYHPYNRK